MFIPFRLHFIASATFGIRAARTCHRARAARLLPKLTLSVKYRGRAKGTGLGIYSANFGAQLSLGRSRSELSHNQTIHSCTVVSFCVSAKIRTGKWFCYHILVLDVSLSNPENAHWEITRCGVKQDCVIVHLASVLFKCFWQTSQPCFTKPKHKWWVEK